MISLIFVISGRLADNVEVVAYIGFAGTIVSILLAVIAIIYSFYQSSTYENATHKLDVSASKIEQITNELSKVSGISGNVEDLKRTVDVINGMVSNIEANMYDQLNIKPNKNHSYGNMNFQSYSSDHIKSEDVEFSYNKEYFTKVASNLTVLAAVVVVWIQKADKYKVKFNIKDCTRFFLEYVMFEERDTSRFLGIENAINGLLIAYEHLFFFDLKKVDKNEFEVRSFNKHFAEVIEEGETQISLLKEHFSEMDKLIRQNKN